MNTRNPDIGWLETVAETLAAIKPGTQEAKMVEQWVEKNRNERATEEQHSEALLKIIDK